MTSNEEPKAGADSVESLRGQWRTRYAPMVLRTLTHRQKADAWISVIVVGERSAERTVTCLDRLRQQQRVGFDRCEAIVAETGYLQPVRELLPLRVDVELRFSESATAVDLINAAVAHSSAPLLAFVDAAALVATDYLAKALAHFEDPSTVGIRARVLANKHPYLAAAAFDYDAGPEPFDDTLVSPHSSLVRSSAFIAAGGFANLPTPTTAVALGLKLLDASPEHKLRYAPDVIMRRDRCESWQDLLAQARVRARFDPVEAALAQRLTAAQRSANSRRSLNDRAVHGVLTKLSQGVSFATRSWNARRKG